MADSRLEDLKNADIGDIAGYFLSFVVIIASIGYIGIVFAAGPDLTPSVLFYGIIPVSLSIILYQTFKVARVIYSSTMADNKKSLNKMVLGLLIGVGALNLGFMTILSSEPKMIQGEPGFYKFILLMVIMSFAVSIGLLVDYSDINQE